MIIKREGHSVDVSDAKCKTRLCFWLLQDKGSFTQGRGYTSYHAKPRWVCGKRHLDGCPCDAICPQCRSVHMSDEVNCKSCRGPLEPLPPKHPINFIRETGHLPPPAETEEP